jgi:hypothetical protein
MNNNDNPRKNVGSKKRQDMTDEERREKARERFVWQPGDIEFIYVPGKDDKNKK